MTALPLISVPPMTMLQTVLHSVFAATLAATVCFSQLARAQATNGHSALATVADIPLPGAAVRFDYQSLDSANHRLYIAHMNDDHLVVFDLRARRVLANLDGFRRVHGVLAVPATSRVYASATGDHKLIAVDSQTLKIVGEAGPISYPDGVAYAPAQRKLFVSDEHAGVDAVVDAATNTLVANIPLGGGAGNTVFDPTANRILVAVHHLNQLVSIDPASNSILARYDLPGIEDPHGIALDPDDGVAFVAGEGNHSLALVDLKTMRILAHPYSVGDDPDVLAFDSGLKRLYVSAESGTVNVFQYRDHALTLLDTLHMPRAHTVAVDPATHLVYFPLENLAGHPVLRILRPATR